MDFFFLISTGLCCYSIISSIRNYLNFDVVTKIRVIEKDFLPFPAVTVCNTNFFLTKEALEYAESFLKNNNLTNFTDHKTFENIFSGKFSKLYFNYNFIQFLTSVSFKANQNQFLKKFSFPINQFLISCLFNIQPCDETNWTWFFDTHYGHCYRFNSINSLHSEIKKSFQAGKYQGLMLELYVGIPNDKRTLSVSNGAHIFINDNPIKPTIGQGLEISPGSYTNIVIGRTKIKQMPKPYSNCIEDLNTIDSFDSEYYRKVFRSNLTYSQTECFYAFIQSEIFKKCNCFDSTVNIIAENQNYCETVDEILCSFTYYREITTSNYKEKISEYCPLECETITYSIQKSHGTYPSTSYAIDLAKSEKIIELFGNKSDISQEELKENILAINIYYENMKQTEITENASISWDGLVGSIGGTLGLFLGMSILSFAELIDLIIQIIYSSLIKNKVNLLSIIK